jgi:hypothetical protein
MRIEGNADWKTKYLSAVTPDRVEHSSFLGKYDNAVVVLGNDPQFRVFPDDSRWPGNSFHNPVERIGPLGWCKYLCRRDVGASAKDNQDQGMPGNPAEPRK